VYQLERPMDFVAVGTKVLITDDFLAIPHNPVNQFGHQPIAEYRIRINGSSGKTFTSHISLNSRSTIKTQQVSISIAKLISINIRYEVDIK